MLQLIGKAFILSNIEVKTGLRIGGTSTGLKIGGVDSPVITDAFNRPYIPGSSLKGKLRSLLEIKQGKPFDHKSGQHQCKTEDDYKQCDVCKIWGIMGNVNFSIPTLTRITVRDTYLDIDSITAEMRENLELTWTEIKTEININRSTGTVSSVGGLRFVERVPAGAKFKDCEIIYNIYYTDDKNLLKKIFEAMELLEDDYLGGMGSRGYGKVAFKDIKVFWNKADNYEKGDIQLTDARKINENWSTPSEIVKNFESIKQKIT